MLRKVLIQTWNRARNVVGQVRVAATAPIPAAHRRLAATTPPPRHPRARCRRAHRGGGASPTPKWPVRTNDPGSAGWKARRQSQF
jgi:hypothetical protein